MNFPQLIANTQSAVRLRIQIVAIVQVVLHGIPQWRHVASLLQALDGGLASQSEPQMPCSEACDYDAYDTRQDSQQDVVDWHERLCVLTLAQYLTPDPCRRCSKADPTKEGQIYEEEQKGLVVAQAHARRKPGAVVVHLQDAALAGRTVVGAVGLLGLALVAESSTAIGGFDGEGGELHTASFGGRQGAVAIVEGKRRPGIGEDGGGVAPVEHEVEEDAEGGRELSGPAICGRDEADARLDPDSPRRQPVDEDQGEVCDGVAAVSLHLSCPPAAAHGARWRGRGRGRA